MYRSGEVSVQREKERNMAHPVFKSCLEHAHSGLTWLRHMQMTELMHVCKGLAESYVDDVIHTIHGSCGAL